jgi:hypothetical protein
MTAMASAVVLWRRRNVVVHRGRIAHRDNLVLGSTAADPGFGVTEMMAG